MWGGRACPPPRVALTVQNPPLTLSASFGDFSSAGREACTLSTAPAPSAEGVRGLADEELGGGGTPSRPQLGLKVHPAHDAF